MAKLSRYLLSPKQLNAPVAPSPDEDEAQETDNQPTVQDVQKDSAQKSKQTKPKKQPSLAAMIAMQRRKK